MKHTKFLIQLIKGNPECVMGYFVDFSPKSGIATWSLDLGDVWYMDTREEAEEIIEDYLGSRRGVSIIETEVDASLSDYISFDIPY